jgi:phosphonate transport system ATP-binding protein
MDTLAEVNRREGITVLVNLHHLDTARDYCGRIVAMKAGRVVFDGAPDALTPAIIAGIYETPEAQPDAAPEAVPAFASPRFATA